MGDEIMRECKCSNTIPDNAPREQYLCETCLTAAKDSWRQTILIQRTVRWEKLCPLTFRETKPDLIPDQQALKQVQSWTYGRQGLLLTGKSGRGKSRSAWLAAQKQNFDGKIVQALNSTSGLEFASRYTNGASDVQQWLKNICECELLLLDDVFKSKLTEAWEGTLFHIVDQRSMWGRPIIVTTNDTEKSLASRMTEDRGQALIRRLTEFCTPIAFK